MARRYRLLAVHLLAVLLPCGVIVFVGYRWLTLERESYVLRGRDTAEAEAADVRRELTGHVAALSRQLHDQWGSPRHGRPPFAPTPELPDGVESTFLFGSDGKLLYPDYEGCFRRAADPARSSATRALALLERGRAALSERKHAMTERHASEILRCCAETRDEYGVSMALYAAAQLVRSYQARGLLQARFAQVAAVLEALLEDGTIGHPEDLYELSRLMHDAGQLPGASALLEQAKRSSNRIAGMMERAREIEKWLSASNLLDRKTPRFSVAAMNREDAAHILALDRGTDGTLLAVLFSNDWLIRRMVDQVASRGRFTAKVVKTGTKDAAAILQVPLFADAPALDLALHLGESDPVAETRRRSLFTGTLVAAVLLVLLVGYFAFRDFSRELELASLRSSFVAGVTHELKTPLTAIRILAETLRMRRIHDPVKADQLLGIVIDETDRLTRLLDNVLNFARIERGSREYRLEEVDLPAAVAGAAERFQSILKQHGFRLVTEINGSPLRVRADRDALTQAVLNLLSNAFKYSGASREVRLAVRRGEDTAEVVVQDHGIGIPRSEHRRIFESFYRAPEAARETTGAGLGLALVHHFAEAHGGRVTVRSEVGRGSTFCISLPLSKVESDGKDPGR